MVPLATASRIPTALVALAMLVAACGGAPPSPGPGEAAAAATAAAGQLTPTPAAVSPTPDLAAALDAYVAGLADRGAFAGSVLIARGGRVVAARGYGLANVEHRVANTPRTKFRLGSITKQFTAMAVLLLQERGRLTVQDRACAHLPDCPSAWGPITIHQLLTHTAGIPNYTNFADYEDKLAVAETPASLMARFKDRPLEFPPGARASYSSSGYVVLGRVIEAVSGRAYDAFLREAIFDPLQMRDTGYDQQLAILEGRAAGYRRVGGTLRHARYIDMSIAYAAGGLYSTVEDLQRWDQALSTGQLASPRTLEAMFTPYADAGGGARFGYGWLIDTLVNRRQVWHGGRIDGFTAGISRFPDDGVLIIVLSNLEEAPLPAMRDVLARMVFDRP